VCSVSAISKSIWSLYVLSKTSDCKGAPKLEKKKRRKKEKKNEVDFGKSISESFKVVGQKLGKILVRQNRATAVLYHVCIQMAVNAFCIYIFRTQS
jgi:hypothetical protein